MQVVAARVHDRHHFSGGVLRCDGAGKREPGLLGNREGVELGAEHDRWPSTVPQHGDDSCLPDSGGHLKAQRFHPRRKFGCGLHFLKGKLRVLIVEPTRRRAPRLGTSPMMVLFALRVLRATALWQRT